MGADVTDNRFKDYPTDARFPSVGVDVRFRDWPTDNRFRDGLDTRFEGSAYGGVVVTVSVVALNPFSATVTPSAGYAIVPGSASIVIPAKPGSYGTAQTVAATVTGGSTGTVTEATAGSVVAALALAGWLDGETPTISVAVDVVASVLPAGAIGIWDISALSSLFQDSAGTTPVTAVGQSVGRPSDKSGNGYHATQANGGLQAKYQIDAAGHPYLLFDGLDDGYVTPTITWGSDEVTIVAGARKLSDAARQMIVELSADINGNNGALNLNTSQLNGTRATYGFGSKGSLISSLDSPAVFSAPHTAVLSASGKISTDTAVLRINGSQVATAATDQGSGAFGSYPLYIGRRGGVSTPFNGRLYCLAIWNRILSADELAQAEAWANARTGAY